MTLDLHLLAPRPGEAPLDTFDRVESDDDLARHDPAAAARDDRLAAAIRAAVPGLEEHRNRHGLSLVGEPLEVGFSRQYATVTLDVEHAAERAALAAQALAVCRVVAAQTGWSVVDAQSGRLLSPVADAHDLLRALEAHRRQAAQPRAGVLARLFGRG